MKFKPFYIVVLLAAPVLVNAQSSRYDIVITEIMADPSPVVGLPNAEYVEIKNRSHQPVNLSGWKLGDASTAATINLNFFLQPDSIVVLCANSQVVAFSAYGKAIGVASFPSLDNSGDLLVLYSPAGHVIHAVPYSLDWYKNPVKEEGGWSLEMVDTEKPCLGSPNWVVSRDMKGGTPGQVNSVAAQSKDEDPPQLLRTITMDSVRVLAVFNEPLDSITASQKENYSFGGGLEIKSVQPVPPVFHEIIIVLVTPLQKKIVYELSVKGVKDCSDNLAGSLNKARAGWAEEASAADVIINEILFNPLPDGSDYIELYNNSKKVLDASQLYVANRSGSNVPASPKKISETPFAIFPGDYVVITEKKVALQKAYFVPDPLQIFSLSSMPSLPDDKGTVVVLNNHGAGIDEVTYSDKWHFPLISNANGVSLEKIDPDADPSNGSNWHSASSTSGYGTPGSKNSQYKQQGIGKASITITPAIFSPDNDGHEDIASVDYQFDATGYVANVTIFNSLGVPVKYLVRNGLTGLKGRWNWDGLDEKGRQLPIGTYVIYTEIFNLKGQRLKWKGAVVVARKL